MLHFIVLGGSGGDKANRVDPGKDPGWWSLELLRRIEDEGWYARIRRLGFDGVAFDIEVGSVPPPSANGCDHFGRHFDLPLAPACWSWSP